jgi:hypothetical protein
MGPHKPEDAIRMLLPITLEMLLLMLMKTTKSRSAAQVMLLLSRHLSVSEQA